MSWNTSAAPVQVQTGKTYYSPITLLVVPNGGDVQIQFEGPDGQWFTPVDPEYTITAQRVVRIARSNTPGLRIVASGDARFKVTGQT